jgi:hypothetical protein
MIPRGVIASEAVHVWLVSRMQRSAPLCGVVRC